MSGVMMLVAAAVNTSGSWYSGSMTVGTNGGLTRYGYGAASFGSLTPDTLLGTAVNYLDILVSASELRLATSGSTLAVTAVPSLTIGGIGTVAYDQLTEFNSYGGENIWVFGGVTNPWSGGEVVAVSSDVYDPPTSVLTGTATVTCGEVDYVGFSDAESIGSVSPTTLGGSTILALYAVQEPIVVGDGVFYVMLDGSHTVDAFATITVQGIGTFGADDIQYYRNSGATTEWEFVVPAAAGKWEDGQIRTVTFA